MKIGFIGLGRMGYNMVQNLLDHKHSVVAYDINKIPVKKLAKKGARPANSVDELFKQLPKPRVVWIMIPSKFVDSTLQQITPHLRRGDTVIDGGNSFFKDSIRRATLLKKKGIHFLDCGTSGGVSGARDGACMMIGGSKNVFKKVEILFKNMCVKNGYGYMGKSGAGHYVKAVHNAIEYGMMGALAEGFTAIESQENKFGTDLKEVAKVYANGSIIESRLASWIWESFKTPGYLEKIACQVPKGETEDEMKFLEQMNNMPVLREARKMRVRSRSGKVCGKLIAAMRNLFGGHAVIRRIKK